jgi:hypothetical protein
MGLSGVAQRSLGNRHALMNSRTADAPSGAMVFFGGSGLYDHCKIFRGLFLNN